MKKACLPPRMLQWVQTRPNVKRQLHPTQLHPQVKTKGLNWKNRDNVGGPIKELKPLIAIGCFDTVSVLLICFMQTLSGRNIPAVYFCKFITRERERVTKLFDLGSQVLFLNSIFCFPFLSASQRSDHKLFQIPYVGWNLDTNPTTL